MIEREYESNSEALFTAIGVILVIIGLFVLLGVPSVPGIWFNKVYVSLVSISIIGSGILSVWYGFHRYDKRVK